MYHEAARRFAFVTNRPAHLLNPRWADDDVLQSVSNANFNVVFFFFSSRRRHTRYWRDWSSDVCSSDLLFENTAAQKHLAIVKGTDLAGSQCSLRLRKFEDGGISGDRLEPDLSSSSAIAWFCLDRCECRHLLVGERNGADSASSRVQAVRLGSIKCDD